MKPAHKFAQPCNQHGHTEHDEHIIISRIPRMPVADWRHPISQSFESISADQLSWLIQLQHVLAPAASSLSRDNQWDVVPRSESSVALVPQVRKRDDRTAEIAKSSKICSALTLVRVSRQQPRIAARLESGSHSHSLSLHELPG